MPEMLADKRPSAVSGDFWASKSVRSPLGAFDPLIYFRTILKYKWPIVLATALITALALFYAMSAEPLYRSTQSLLLESTESNIVAIEDLIKDAPQDAGYVQTRMEILKSRDLAQRVLSSLNLLAEPVFLSGAANFARTDVEQLALEQTSLPINSTDQAELDAPIFSDSDKESMAINYYLSRLSIVQVPTTRLVRISYLSADRELAAKIANEVGLQYIRSYVESNQSMVDEASSWLDVRLDELKKTLDDSESRLLAFKKDNQLINVNGSVGRITEQELIQSTIELANARMQLSDAGIVIDDLKNVTTPEDMLEILPAAMTDPLVRNARLEIDRVSREIDSLSTTYGPRNPRIIALVAELRSLQAGLSLSLQGSIDAAKNDFSVLQKKVNLLESRLEFDRQAVQQVGEKSVQLEALETEVQTNRDLYHRFLGRMIETRSTEGLESVNATVAEFATPSLGPAKPNKALIVALAFFGALSLSMLAALIAGGLDNSIKHPSDVEQKLGERLLGIIPWHRKKRGWLARLVPGGMSARKKDSRLFMEAYTTLRTNLLLDQRHEPGKVVLLTSSVPGEGKSMSSICLARSFAQMERVLLIDADIRRPSLGTALKLDMKLPGLTNYILGQNELHQCIQRHQSSGIDVLCSGPVTNQPLEMLSSVQFEDALSDLEAKYDRIIIDCAPVEAVSDALLLSKLVDRVIYVAKSHDTAIKMVNNGLEKLYAVGAPVCGVLLTQVDLAKLAVYGGEYGFLGYYDYYGYSAPSNDKAYKLDREQLQRIYSRTPSTVAKPQTEDVA